MNQNDFLIKLSESDRTDFGRVEFKHQIDEQRIFSAIWELESEVNNGGFGHYFASWSGETASFAPTALRCIGAIRCAEIVEKAIRVVSPQPLPVDQSARQKIVDTLSDEDCEHLAALDGEFFAYPDNLTELLFSFVQSHPAVFGPIK